MNTCLVIAGEKSGEEHALSFFDDLIKNCPNIHFYGVGGDDLKKRGLELSYHLKEFSSMGFSEVFFKVLFYFRAFKKLINLVEERKTKVAILIDFQTFNLKLAKKLSQKGVTVLYYVAPQAWVWKPKRAYLLQKYVHTLFTIIPFEKKWFTDRGVERVLSMTHPVLRRFALELDNYKRMPRKPKKILLLPGSRNSEIKYILPLFWSVVCDLKKEFDIELSLVISENTNLDHYGRVPSLVDKVYTSHDIAEAIKDADICLSASGTVTLTCALFQCPTIVTYVLSLFNDFMAETLISYTGYISLANIVHEEEVFPEFVQDQARKGPILNSLRRYMTDQLLYERTCEQLASTKSKVSGEMQDPANYMSGIISEVYSKS